MFQLEEMAAVAALFVEYNIQLMEVWDSGLYYGFRCAKGLLGEKRLQIELHTVDFSLHHRLLVQNS